MGDVAAVVSAAGWHTISLDSLAVVWRARPAESIELLLFEFVVTSFDEMLRITLMALLSLVTTAAAPIDNLHYHYLSYSNMVTRRRRKALL